MKPNDPKPPDHLQSNPQSGGPAVGSLRRLRFDAAHCGVPRPMRPRGRPDGPDSDQPDRK